MKLQSALETIKAMHNQEENSYAIDEYLHQGRTAPLSTHGPLNVEPVDYRCRFAMAKWCFDAADHFQFLRETAAIALSCLDRYASSKDGRKRILTNHDAYELAAMTCFYTAVKIHEQTVIDSQMVSFLSQGAYTKEQVEAMEVSILQALQWRVNPPTAMSYIRELLSLIPLQIFGDELTGPILELAKKQTEYAVQSSDLAFERAWSIAAASLMNAVEFYANKDALDHLRELLVSVGLYQKYENGSVICDIQRQLSIAVVQKQMIEDALQSYSVPTQQTKSNTRSQLRRRSSIAGSPRSILATFCSSLNTALLSVAMI